MKWMMIISSTVSMLLLLSTLICGLWIRSKNITEPSSISFHMQIGILTVVACLISCILLIIKAGK